MTRRDYLQLAALGAAAAGPLAFTARASGGEADRAARMKWWHEARFGMFIHWGLYSLLGRHEWAMETEGIPVAEYEQLAKRFKPKPNAARDWAKLAKAAGQKYMVMTTKHHEGFCHFDSKLTNYSAPKQGPGRDLVKEYVEAARAAGVNLAFFSGNEVFWKTRWEDSIDGTNTPYRTLVCYKETLGPNSVPTATAAVDPLLGRDQPLQRGGVCHCLRSQPGIRRQHRR